MNHTIHKDGHYFEKYIYDFGEKDQGAYMQMFGMTFGLITICIWQLEGYSALSLIYFVIGLLFHYGSAVTAIRFKSKDIRLYVNTVVIILLEGAFLLYLCANKSTIQNVIGGKQCYIIILGFIISFLAHLAQILFTTGKWIVNKERMMEIIIVGMICIVFGFLVNIECFDTWPRWDSFNYYYSFKTLSARNIFLPARDGLTVCGHISTSYVLWTLLFRSLPIISDLNAMYLSNIVIIMIDVVLLYLIFKWLLKDILKSMLFTVIVVCSPPILGFAAAFNMEIISTTGILLLLYAIFVKNKTMSILALFIVCNAKETGALMAAVIIFMQLLYDLAEYTKDRREKIDLAYYSLSFSVGLFWLLQIKASNWSNGASAERAAYMHTIDGADYNRFGFSKVHIIDSILGSLVSQFNWMFLILLICIGIFASIQLIQKKKRIKQLLAKREYWIIMAAFSAYIMELCVFVTYKLYRYYITSSVLLYILVLCSVAYIWDYSNRKKSIGYAAVIMIGGLLAVQSYTSCDPITALIYPKISTGDGAVFNIKQNNNVTKEPYFFETAYGNRQIMYFDKILDRAYAQIYDESHFENTKILCSDEYIGKIYDGKIQHGSRLSIWGYDLGMSSDIWGQWNNEKRCRYLSHESKNSIDPEFVGDNTDINQYLEQYKYVYYIEMPWGDKTIGELLDKIPPVMQEQTLKYRGWILKIYRIK